MTETPNRIIVKAPGRLCLMGEHQDYFGLEVVSGAFDRYIVLDAVRIKENHFELYLQKYSRTRIIDFSKGPTEASPRDYLQSGVNVALSEGYCFNNGWHITISGDLPSGKGVSSSSALCVGWLSLLSAMENSWQVSKPDFRMTIARMAFKAEVTEFNEPGGMQDHVASALGGLLHMSFENGLGNPIVRRLSCIPEGFFLVDSKSTKDTLGMLRNIRNDVETKLQVLFPGKFPADVLKKIQLSDLHDLVKKSRGFERLKATIINRNLTRYAAANLFNDPETVQNSLGRFINTHHAVLRDLLRTSAPDIDKICSCAISSGAYGAKVIGSGGGGSLLVYAPVQKENVIWNLQKNKVEVDAVKICDGVQVTCI